MYYIEGDTMSELTYDVEKQLKLTKTTGPDIYELTPIKSKSVDDMTDTEEELWMAVRLYGELPDDAEEGDVYTPWELLPEGHQTPAQRDQDALDEAAETGEEVVITSTTVSCNDDTNACNLDRVARVATPEGEIDKRRTHTY